MPQPGTRLGRFELGAVLALSSRAVIYEASQAQPGPRAVCKLFLQPPASEEAGQAALRERIERTEPLDDPLVPKIRETGHHQGLLFATMDRVDGTAVRFDGSQPPLPPSLAARVVERLARTLHAAHREGLVHDDLADSHVMLDGTDRVHLLGLARAEPTADPDLPAIAISAMPPESAGEGGVPASVRSNVHSLGMLLYVLLTGSPPFRAATRADALRLVQANEVPSPRVVNPLVPPDLAAIAQRCLARDPARRYDSAQELAIDLSRFLRSESSPGAGRSWLRHLAAALRHHPARTLGAVLFAGALVAGGMIGLSKIQIWRDRHAGLLLEQAAANRLVGKRAEALERIGQAARLRTDAATRQVAIETVTLPELRLVARIPMTEACQVRFSADGSLVAAAGIGPASQATSTGTASPTVRVHDLSAERSLGELPWAVENGPMAFHPEDPWLAVPQPDGTTALWTPRAGQPPAYLPAVGIPLFAPGGRRLAVGTPNTNIVVHALATLQEEARLAAAQPVCWATDDELLIRTRDRVEAWNVASGNRRLLAGAGQRLLAVAPEAGIAVWQIPDALADTAALSLRSLDDQTEFWCPEGLATGNASPLFWFRAQGSRAFVGDRLDPSLLRVLDVSNHRYLGSLSLPGAQFGRDPAAASSGSAPPPASLRERMPPLDSAHPDRDLASAITRDGRHLAVAIGTRTPVVEVQDLLEGRLVASLPRAGRPVWSLDGRKLAVVRPATTTTLSEPAFETVEVWELRIPAPSLRLAQPIRQVAFSENGARFAAAGRTIEWRYLGGRPTLVDSGEEPAGLVVGPDSAGGKWGVAEALIAGTLPLELQSSSGETRTLPKNGDLTRLAFAPDGERLLLAHGTMQPGPAPGAGATNHFELWNLWRGGQEAVWAASPGVASGGPVEFSPDGARVASAFFQTEGIELIDAATGKRERLLLTAAAGESAGSGLGRMFRPITKPVPRHAVRVIRFDRDGRHLYAGTAAGWWCEVECDSGNVILARPAHEGEITALALDPNGSLAATSGKDGLVRLHRLPDGAEVARWRGPRPWFTALEFSPDGKLLVAGSEDGLLQLWHLPALREELAALGLEW